MTDTTIPTTTGWDNMGRVKAVDVTIDSVDDGLNTTDPASAVGFRHKHGKGRNQLTEALDFMVHNNKQRPGSNGASGVFSTWCRGLGTYLQHDGTDRLLSVSGGKLYLHSKTSPYGTTELYDIGGNGQARFADYLDICVVANGTGVVKVEGATAYKLGIDAPTGAASALRSGGSLPDGEYNIIVTHTRQSGGSALLHSRGQSLTAQTCTGGNNTIRITFPDYSSTDAQVTHVTVWMTDVGGTTYYYYGEAAIDAGYVDVSSNASRNTALLYSVEAQRNYTIPAFEYILMHNGYLYGSVGNTLYRSLRAGSRYDLERFDTRSSGGNVADYPFQITGLYAIGEHVYINTPAGIIRIPNGDISAEYDHVEQLNNFRYPNTVRPWNGGLIGLTRHGVQFFDGDKILPHDIAQDVKPTIQRIYDGYNSDTPPGAAVYRRNDRTEYHLLYKDNTVSTTHHNRRLVLNLDTVRFAQESKVWASWEIWQNGAAYMVVDNSDTWYCAQSLADDGVIYTEHGTQNRDKNLYIAGALETDYEYGWKIKTGRIIHSIQGLVRWYQARIYASYSAEITVNIDVSIYPDNTNEDTTLDASSGDVPRYGIARYGVDRYAPEGPVWKKAGLKRNLKGVGVIITVSGAKEDRSLELYQLVLLGHLTETRFT